MAHSLLQEIYLKHAPEIYRFSFFKVRNKEEAEDITAETFTRLAHTNIGEIHNVRAWLFKVCRNIIYDTYMRGAERNIQKVDSDMAMDVKDTDASVEDIVIESSLRQAIQESLQKIDQPVADIIVMKIWEGMQFNEIAEATESNISTVKAQYYRGIDKIKEITVQGNPKFRTYSFTAPIVAAGVFTMGQSSQFTISSAAVSAVGATAGIMATGAATTAGLFSAGAVQAIAAIIATGAVTVGGIAGVQYLSTQSEKPTTVECMKTFQKRDDLELSFTYDSCKYLLAEQQSDTKKNIPDVTLTPNDKNQEYQISLTINEDVSIAGNANIFCGDEFYILKDTNIARVRAYKLESTEEFIYYGTILKTEDITYPRTKTIQDIDGKNSKDSFRARLVGSSKQIMCVSNSGIVQLNADTVDEQVEDTLSLVHLSIEGKGISKLSTDLKLIDDLSQTINLTKKEEEKVDVSNWKDIHIELGQSAESLILFTGSVKAPADSVVTKDIIASDSLPIDVRIRNGEFNLDITYKLRSLEQTYVYDSMGEIESDHLGKLYRLTDDDLTHTYTSVISKNVDCELFSPKVKAPCGFGYILYPKLDDSFNGISVVCKGLAEVCDEAVLTIQPNKTAKNVEHKITLAGFDVGSNTVDLSISGPADATLKQYSHHLNWPSAEFIGSDFRIEFTREYESFPQSLANKSVVKIADNLWVIEYVGTLEKGGVFIDNLQNTDCGSPMIGEIKPPCSPAPSVKGLRVACTGDLKKCGEIILTLKVETNTASACTKEFDKVIEQSRVRFTYDACKYEITESQTNSEMLFDLPNQTVTIEPLHSEKEYKIKLEVLHNAPVTGNLAIFCGDTFKTLAKNSLNRLRTYSSKSDTEMYYYGKSLSSSYVNYPRAIKSSDIDGAVSEFGHKLRVVGDSSQVQCIDNLGLKHYSGDSTLIPGQLPSVHTINMFITSENLSNISESDLAKADAIAESLVFEKAQ